MRLSSCAAERRPTFRPPGGSGGVPGARACCQSRHRHAADLGEGERHRSTLQTRARPHRALAPRISKWHTYELEGYVQAIDTISDLRLRAHTLEVGALAVPRRATAVRLGGRAQCSRSRQLPPARPHCTSEQAQSTAIRANYRCVLREATLGSEHVFRGRRQQVKSNPPTPASALPEHVLRCASGRGGGCHTVHAARPLSALHKGPCFFIHQLHMQQVPSAVVACTLLLPATCSARCTRHPGPPRVRWHAAGEARGSIHASSWKQLLQLACSSSTSVNRRCHVGSCPSGIYHQRR
jgi:hypothetical protein